MGWKIFREIARPFEQAAHSVGLSSGGVLTFRGTVGAATSRLSALGSSAIHLVERPDRRSSYVDFGRNLVPIAAGAAVIAGGVGALSYLSSPAAGSVSAASTSTSAPWLTPPTITTFETAQAAGFAPTITALGPSSAVTASAIAAPTSGLQLEAAAGAAQDTTVYATAAPTSWISGAGNAALTGAAASVGSRLLNQGVNAAVDSIFGKGVESSPGGFGGGGGGAAGGGPFTAPNVNRGGSDLYLGLAAAVVVLFAIVKMAKG